MKPVSKKIQSPNPRTQRDYVKNSLTLNDKMKKALISNASNQAIVRMNK